MKKLLIAFLIAGIMGILSMSASAAPYQVNVGDDIRLTDYNRLVNAGGMVFDIRNENDRIYDSWTTFCMEYDETTVYGRWYEIKGIVDGMIAFGFDDDEQDKWNEIAWLYQSYMENTLIGFNPYNSYDQAALQYAFWELTGDVGIGSNPYSNSNTIFYRSQAESAVVFGGWRNDLNQVMVAVNDGQDVLVYSAAPVPEPATMLLLGTGLIGLAGFGRKKFLK